MALDTVRLFCDSLIFRFSTVKADEKINIRGGLIKIFRFHVLVRGVRKEDAELILALIWKFDQIFRYTRRLLHLLVTDEAHCTALIDSEDRSVVAIIAGRLDAG